MDCILSHVLLNLILRGKGEDDSQGLHLLGNWTESKKPQDRCALAEDMPSVELLCHDHGRQQLEQSETLI